MFSCVQGVITPGVGEAYKCCPGQNVSLGDIQLLVWRTWCELIILLTADSGVCKVQGTKTTQDSPWDTHHSGGSGECVYTTAGEDHVKDRTSFLIWLAQKQAPTSQANLDYQSWFQNEWTNQACCCRWGREIKQKCKASGIELIRSFQPAARSSMYASIYHLLGIEEGKGNGVVSWWGLPWFRLPGDDRFTGFDSSGIR